MISTTKLAFGEFIGTYILVLIGCSSVALEVLHSSFNSLAIVASIWGIGVILAILASRPFSPAHLNPAVSIAMATIKKTPWRQVPMLIGFQFFGALCAGATIYYLFSTSLLDFETNNNILRGSEVSQASAIMFGEFFTTNVKHPHLYACIAEGTGTFLLMTVILVVSRTEKINTFLPPLFIGLGLSIIIFLIAPYTQAGLNPARDFAPRILAYFFGWENAAFPQIRFSFFTVYILSPIVGALIAAGLHAQLSKQRNLTRFRK
jgi:glycerol uptake facilitator protein